MDKMDLYEKGLEAFEKKNYEEAEKYFEKLLLNGYNFPDVLNKLAVLKSFKGDYENAVQLLKKALEINPRYSEAAINLIYVLNELGRYDEAKKIQEKLKNITLKQREKTLDPFVIGKIANLHAELGERYVEIGLYEDAINEYKKAIKLRPTFVDLRTRLAVLLREQGEIEEAIEHLTQCLLEKKDYIPALIQLGLTYYVMGEYELAKKQWNRVLSIDPNNSFAKLYINMLENIEKK